MLLRELLEGLKNILFEFSGADETLFPNYEIVLRKLLKEIIYS